MAKPIQKNLRVPRDMAPLITAEAQKQGVSENAWMLAVIAAVVGYKLPEK
jgi:predicted HicB family RNase H-like nuclease